MLPPAFIGAAVLHDRARIRTTLARSIAGGWAVLSEEWSSASVPCDTRPPPARARDNKCRQFRLSARGGSLSIRQFQKSVNSPFLNNFSVVYFFLPLLFVFQSPTAASASLPAE